MEEIRVCEQTAPPAVFRGKEAFSMVDEKALAAWRRGMIESRMIFLFTVGILVTGMIALAVLYARTTALPESAGVSEDNGRYQESIVQESEPEVEWLSSQLHLSEDQVARIRPIVDEEQRQINLAVADESKSSEERISEVNQIRLGALDRLAPVLKDAQAVRLHQLREQEKGEARAVWNQSSENGKQ